MPYCQQCGAGVDTGMRFCPNCGAILTAGIGDSNYTGASYQTEEKIYRVILLNLGKCSRSKARECLTEYINYSVSDANAILNSLPAEIACNLSISQAKALAKVLTNSGMQAAICDEDDYVDMNSAVGGNEPSTGNGNVWTGILGVLATLGIVNQVSQIRRWNRPYVRRHIYGYQPFRPAPPRTMGRGAAPKPPMGGFGGGGPARPPRGGRPGGFGGGFGPGSFGGGGGPGGHGGGRGPGGR